MRAADFLTAAILLLLGVVVLFDAIRLGFGWGTDGPKSGFFPFWLALIMVVTCGLIILQTLRRPSGETFVTRQRRFGPQSDLARNGDGATYAFRGLYVAAALYMGFYMRWVGCHSWLA